MVIRQVTIVFRDDGKLGLYAPSGTWGAARGLVFEKETFKEVNTRLMGKHPELVPGPWGPLDREDSRALGMWDITAAASTIDKLLTGLKRAGATEV